MSHFGPYTPLGLTFDFAFHHVVEIKVTETQICTNFCTRKIVLYDADGQKLVITCFSNNEEGHIPLTAIDENDL